MASGFGSVLASFGARTAASAPTLPLPLRSRKRANERVPASMRISERLLMPSATPRRHEGTYVLWLETRERRERDALTKMAAQEGEELDDVALVGLDRLRRHPPLGREVAEPVRQLARDIRGREGKLQLGPGLRHEVSDGPRTR